jgi:hypothetical protein
MAVDLCGFGASPKPPFGDDYADYVADLVALIQTGTSGLHRRQPCNPKMPRAAALQVALRNFVVSFTAEL